MTDTGPTWAIIPLRGLETAKTRLGPSLDAEERLALVIEMATRTLTATRDAEAVAGTVLVTADPAAAEVARAFGAVALVQHLPGLNAALREGRDEAVRRGATSTIVVPIDLPAINATGLDDLLAEIRGVLSGAGKLVAMVPDRHGRGTNILFTAPPAVIDPHFGDASFVAHRQAAAVAGARFLVLGGALTLDVDTGDDLLMAESNAGREGGTDAHDVTPEGTIDAA